MDKETIEKAAMGLAPRRDQTSQALRYKFKQGVEWLMQQPLKDRLNEADKKEIANWINDIAFFMPDKRSITMLKIGAKSLFGNDLFNDNK